jgi:hypothetical protein
MPFKCNGHVDITWYNLGASAEKFVPRYLLGIVPARYKMLHRVNLNALVREFFTLWCLVAKASF